MRELIVNKTASASTLFCHDNRNMALYLKSQNEKWRKAFGEYEYLTLNDKMCNSHIDSCLLTVFLIAKDFDGKAMIGTMMT